jgi:hypothetical protein
MKAHWENLENVPSAALMDLWRTMASAFALSTMVGAGVLKGSPGVPQQWHVLQLPTGTGKTQGACLYAALVAKGNKGAQGSK